MKNGGQVYEFKREYSGVACKASVDFFFTWIALTYGLVLKTELGMAGTKQNGGISDIRKVKCYKGSLFIQLVVYSRASKNVETDARLTRKLKKQTVCC
ncbi:hypothetical protein [Sessilibacter corallicola]|uniref:Transposase n=1 Tax=Sessilibacter corallicola TaxID=2904075 RepID=A0ABQ0A8E5_9GAMM